MNNELRAQFGLTLVEMLIVVAIIVMLAAMIISVAARIDNQTKEKGMKNIFAILEDALLEYKDFAGDFPPADPNANPYENCEILYGELDFIPASQKVLKKINDKLIQNKYDLTADPPKYEIYDLWGTVLNYIYITGDNFPELISAGRDKSFGTPDDISNK